MPFRVDGDLDLASTLYSGQAFRWRPLEGGWHEGFIGNHLVRVRRFAAGIECSGEATPSHVRRYFRLEGTHERFLAEVRRDEPLDRALSAYPGLRVLGQDPWEVFAAYILSANSNVGKISRTIESLARLASGTDRAERPPFPSAGAVAGLTESQLRSTGMGYRAPYLSAAAALVERGDLDLDALSRLPYDEAHARLVEAPGVGAKVADCILLYGCSHFGAFPIDVWIDRVLREEYFPRKRMNYRAWGEWARSHFGAWAGYAQHYLFHERRLAGATRAASSHAIRRRASRSARERKSAATPLGVGNVTPS